MHNLLHVNFTTHIIKKEIYLLNCIKKMTIKVYIRDKYCKNNRRNVENCIYIFFIEFNRRVKIWHTFKDVIVTNFQQCYSL